MGNLLMGAGFPGGSFQTPVITVGDEVHYNIKDLRNFLANLKPAAVTEKQATAAEDIESSEASGAEKRINVYHKQGCHRFEIVVKYLKANNIAYQKLDITKNEKNAEEMWALLRADGHKKGTIQTPVITVGDQLHYNIKDLTGFLEGLKR